MFDVPKMQSTSNKWFKILTSKRLLWIVGILLAVLILNPIKIIESGSRGLRFTMGDLDKGELVPGVHFYLPFFQSIEVIEMRQQELSFTVNIGPEAAITKDNQSVGATIIAWTKFKPGTLGKLWTTTGVEGMQNLAMQTAQEAFKVAIGRCTIFDIAAKQDTIKLNVRSLIEKELKEYPITLADLVIRNYDWSEEFEAQIENTMKQAQQVKQKQQELLVAEQISLKQVKEAEARKTAQILDAEGAKESAKLRAEAKELEGEGIRKYNQSIAANMALEIELRKLENERIKWSKWNGWFVPENHYGPIPIQSKGWIEGLNR
jgi:prohibitin 2